VAARPHDLIIVGAGPGGLCAAGAARALGWEPLLLEGGARIGGAWPHLPPDLRCLSPRTHDLLPDGSHPTGPGVRASAAEVVAWLDRYAARERFDVRMGVRVTGLVRQDAHLRLTTDQGSFLAQRVVLATGEYSRPRIPDLPGTFDGLEEHSHACDPATVRDGERVLLVGTGNSAIDLLPRLLARGAVVTVSARSPFPRPEGLPTGARARLLWEASAIPVRLLPRRLRCTDRVPPIDADLFDAIASGQVRRVGETIGLEPGGARAAGGELVEVDRIVWAVGFRRALAWLPTLSTDPITAAPAHREGLSTDLDGVGFLGLPCMRTRRSGFLRGFSDDAAAVLRGLGSR
jgi:putative flavoprotein involved in K+ transport